MHFLKRPQHRIHELSLPKPVLQIKIEGFIEPEPNVLLNSDPEPGLKDQKLKIFEIENMTLEWSQSRFRSTTLVVK
jgi:hypothetical protein